jgi:hypothetical protein
MKNILPHFQTFSVDEGEQTKLKYHRWRPESTDIKNFEFPKYLEKKVAVSPDEIKQKPFEKSEPPNDKYIDEKSLIHDEPNPLNEENRGDRDVSILKKPQNHKSKAKQIINSSNTRIILINFANYLSSSFDIFLQRHRIFRQYAVNSDGAFIQSTVGVSKAQSHHEMKLLDTELPLIVQTTATNYITMPFTKAKEIKHIDFQSGPIGLEIEYQNGVIKCTKVLPNLQASSYGTLLLNAEILAVNMLRVFSLHEFRSRFDYARTLNSTVTVTFIVNAGEKSKLESLYEYGFRNEHRNIRSIMEEMLRGDDDSDESVIGDRLSSSTLTDDVKIMNESPISIKSELISDNTLKEDLKREDPNIAVHQVKSHFSDTSHSVTRHEDESVSDISDNNSHETLTKDGAHSSRNNFHEDVESKRDFDATLIESTDNNDDSSGDSDSDSDETITQSVRDHLSQFRRREASEQNSRSSNQSKNDRRKNRRRSSDELNNLFKNDNFLQPVKNMEIKEKEVDDSEELDDILRDSLDFIDEKNFTKISNAEVSSVAEDDEHGKKSDFITSMLNEPPKERQLSEDRRTSGAEDLALLAKKAVRASTHETFQDIDDDEQKQWDYTTSMNTADESPFIRLVCVSPCLERSQVSLMI